VAKRVAKRVDASRPGIVLDAGALLSIEAGKLTDVLAEAHAQGLPIRLSGGALAQAWRGGPRSARLAAVLKKGALVVALDAAEGRHVGEFIARRNPSRGIKPDVVDAHTAFLTRETRSLVYTSDAEDLARYGVAEKWIRNT
jgi:hypothetical protein